MGLEKTCQGVGDLGTCLEKVASVGLLLQVQKCLLASEGTHVPSIHMVESTDESQCRDTGTLGKPQNRGRYQEKPQLIWGIGVLASSWDGRGARQT